MKTADQDYRGAWQEKLAERLRRGNVEDVRTETRNGLHFVVAQWRNSEGQPRTDEYAYFSKPQLADEAVRIVKRLAALN